MQETFDELEDLLKNYRNFKLEGRKGLSNFGVFLQKQSENNPSPQEVQAYPPGVPLPALIGHLWGRMLRHTAFLTKKALEETELRSLDEFGILITVEQHNRPSKSQIVQETLQEPTTCFESIKRLERLSLIKEHPDAEDKRVRRVSFTEKGAAHFRIVKNKVFLLAQVLVGNSSEAEQVQLLQLLKNLDAYHSQLAINERKESIEEVVKGGEGVH